MVQQQMQLVSSWLLEEVFDDLYMETVSIGTEMCINIESFLSLTVLVIVCEAFYELDDPKADTKHTRKTILLCK